MKNEVCMKKFSNSKAWTVISILICLVLAVIIWLVVKYLESPTDGEGDVALLSSVFRNFQRLK